MAFNYNPSQFEYTPEISKQYRDSLATGIQQNGAVAVGQARGEALRRGLEGDPYEALRVGAAKSNTANQLNSLDANLAYQGAGLQREERMNAENFDRQSTQQEKMFNLNSAQEEKMAGLNYNYQKELAKFAAKQQRKNAWSALPGQILSTAAGAGTSALLGI